MTATVTPIFSSHRSSAGPDATNAGPEFNPTALPAANDGSGETFTQCIDRATGRVSWLTEHGRAERFNGLWFVAREGCRPRYVGNPEFRAALDANERRAS